MASLQSGLLFTDFGSNSEMLVFLEGGKLEKPKKYPRSKDENQHSKLSPHMKPGPGIEPRPHCLEARNKETNGKL